MMTRHNKTADVNSYPFPLHQEPESPVTTQPFGHPLRQGAVYGALEAVQVAARVAAGKADQSPEPRAHLEVPLNFTGGANLSPEEAWDSIPAGGEASWKNSANRTSLRLRVAQLQEALSDAASGLQKASEVCRGIDHQELLQTGLPQLGLSSIGSVGSPWRECEALEAEAKELQQEKTFLDGRIAEVQQELVRAKESLRPPTTRSRSPRSQEPEAQPESLAKKAPDVSELAVVLRLLACLKDVALNNRSLIFPTDPAQWTREQQVVAYFLDEVEICTSRLEKSG